MMTSWRTKWRYYRQGAMQTDPAKVSEYFADRRLMWHNIILVMIGNLGYGVAFTVINPLMLMKMKDVGISESWIGGILGGNAWLVSFLVMFFSWQSDHLVSRFGRRTPYLLVSAPPIILVALLFPFFDNRWILLGLWILQLLFLDMKASTYTLIMIDCVPRKELASLAALSSLIPSVCNFMALRYGMSLTHVHEALPYLIGAPLMLVCTLAAGLGVIEPPVYHPAKERFKPWSTLKIAWQDKRVIWLMLGVGTIHAFLNLYGNWVWLFAKSRLGLEKGAIADSLSWSVLISVAIAVPTGWIVDRFGGRKVVMVFWIMQLTMFFVLMRIISARGLMVVAVLQCLTTPLYTAADIMVFKSAAPEHVGSITASNSFLRNMIAGCLLFASGQLIDWSGYPAAFVMGMAVSTFGLGCFFIHQWVMLPSPRNVMLMPIPSVSESSCK